jgi:hypothetical protein
LQRHLCLHHVEPAVAGIGYFLNNRSDFSEPEGHLFAYAVHNALQPADGLAVLRVHPLHARRHLASGLLSVPALVCDDTLQGHELVLEVCVVHSQSLFELSIVLDGLRGDHRDFLLHIENQHAQAPDPRAVVLNGVSNVLKMRSVHFVLLE